MVHLPKSRRLVLSSKVITNNLFELTIIINCRSIFTPQRHMRTTEEAISPLTLDEQPIELDGHDQQFVRKKYTRRRKRLRSKCKKGKRSVDILDMPSTPHNTTQYLLQHRSYEEFDLEDLTGSMINSCSFTMGAVYNITL
jgi:hypothetical protein